MGWHILTKPNCPYCVKAKSKLTIIGETFTVEDHTTEEQLEAFKAAGHRTFPRIYKDGELIGGFEDLAKFLAEDDF